MYKCIMSSILQVTTSYQQKIGILETRIIDKEMEKGYVTT